MNMKEIKKPDVIDITRNRVEKILSKLLRVEVHLDRNDSRIISIHEDILRRFNGGELRISDEEITGYVRKYYRFRAVVGETETS